MSFTPSNQEGAGNAGCRLTPAVSCARCAGDAHTSIQVQPEQPGIPCAMGLRLIPCSPWRRIPFASIAAGLTASSKPGWIRKTSASLTPATGARTTRLCRTRQRQSSARGARSRALSPPCEHLLTRPTLPRPPLPAPTFVTIAIRPSSGHGMAGFVRVIWVDDEAEYFFVRDWTGQIKLKLLEKIGLSRKSLFARASYFLNELTGWFTHLEMRHGS